MALFDWISKLRGKNDSDGYEKFDNPTIAVGDDYGDSDIVTEKSVQESGVYSQMVDQYFTSFMPDIQNTVELINTYRDLEEIQEVDFAIQEIVDQAIVVDTVNDFCTVELDNTDFSSGIKKKIGESWDDVLNVLNFRDNAQQYFRRWYVDSRIHFLITVDESEKRINGAYRLDPRYVKKVREYITDKKDSQDVYVGMKEYYVYKPQDKSELSNLQSYGVSFSRKKAAILPNDSVVSSYSGLTDKSGVTISYLHRAIRPVNQLKMIEDAIIVYRIARAPERRAFYVDTGGMGVKASKKYIEEMKEGLRRKSVYDPVSGKVKSQYDVSSIGEDYWLPRRNGKNTEIQTLSGAQNLGELADIEYFNRKVWSALRLPMTRLEERSMFGGGREMEISRDELRFDKLVQRLRNEFRKFMSQMLKTNIILKGIMTEEEWNEEDQNIAIVFNEDSFFKEAKELELLRDKLGLLRDVTEYEGKYFSQLWVKKHILGQTEDEIKEIQKQIDDEPAPDEESKGRPGFGF